MLSCAINRSLLTETKTLNLPTHTAKCSFVFWGVGGAGFLYLSKIIQEAAFNS